MLVKLFFLMHRANCCPNCAYAHAASSLTFTKIIGKPGIWPAI